MKEEWNESERRVECVKEEWSENEEEWTGSEKSGVSEVKIKEE